MEEEFLKICNEVFKENIEDRSCVLEDWEGLTCTEATKQAKEEYNEKFSELCDKLIKLFI